jgi:dihydroneopterin aldolase
MNIVSIHNLKIYAYHGCLPEEAVIGTNYKIDIDIFTDFLEAAIADNLAQTIDYVVIADIVKKEMAIQSKLIENAALRILNKIKQKYPEAQKVKIRLYKINPPANADLDAVSVCIEA